jgi:hypothetical protein
MTMHVKNSEIHVLEKYGKCNHLYAVAQTNKGKINIEVRKRGDRNNQNCDFTIKLGGVHYPQRSCFNHVRAVIVGGIWEQIINNYNLV